MSFSENYKSFTSSYHWQEIRPNDQRPREITRDENIGVIQKDFKIMIRIFKNRGNETKKSFLMDNFTKYAESIKIIKGNSRTENQINELDSRTENQMNEIEASIYGFNNFVVNKQ